MSVKEKIIEKKGKAKQWVTEHKDDIVYVCYIVVITGATVAPIIRRARRNHIDIRREYQIYDPSTGFRWDLRRKLTNNQKLMIEDRRRNGESYGHILRDMNLLRR